jgi:hypothetical protein
VKDALLRTRLTHRQIALAYDYLIRDDHDAMGGLLGLACSTGWLEPVDEAKDLRWAREFYHAGWRRE